MADCSSLFAAPTAPSTEDCTSADVWYPESFVSSDTFAGTWIAAALSSAYFFALASVALSPAAMSSPTVVATAKPLSFASWDTFVGTSAAAAMPRSARDWDPSSVLPFIDGFAVKSE